MRLADRMSSPPCIVKPDVPYYDALATMQARKVAHLPVVDDSGTLLGMVSESGLSVVAARYLDRAVASGFLRPQHRAMLMVAERPTGLLQQFSSYVPPNGEKWR